MKKKITEYKVLPKSFIVPRATCLEPSSFSYHHSFLGKYLESTPSFDCDLFLSLHKKNIVNETKIFHLKTDFQFKPINFLIKQTLPNMVRETWNLKTKSFLSHSNLHHIWKEGLSIRVLKLIQWLRFIWKIMKIHRCDRSLIDRTRLKNLGSR